MRNFQNDMQSFKTKDDVLTLLIHLGYLAYDSREEEAFIPNKEIIGEFENAVSVGGWLEIVRNYRLIRELPAGHGFADIVFLPLSSVNKPALVVELKYDKTAYTAIQQIKDRQYTQALEGYVGKILAVGINYDRNNANKPHSCVIEKMKK